MISFIRNHTTIVLTFTVLFLSVLFYKVSILNGFLRVLSEEMASNDQDDASKASNVYGFKVKDLDGNEVDMEKYR